MNKLKKLSTQLQKQQTKQLPQKKHQLMKDLLPCIVVTAPVFHAEMSELKAVLDLNTTQSTAGRTTKWREEAANK